MKNRSAEEILNFTFAHLEKVLREKGKENGEMCDKAGRRSPQVRGQEEATASERVAETAIRGGSK